MRSPLLVLLLIGTTHALLGTIGNMVSSVGDKVQAVTNQVGQTASNLWNGATNQVGNMVNGVVDTVTGVHDQVVSTVNTVQFAANFLWGNIFGPAYDLMIEGGQGFLDDKFGNVISTIGRRAVVSENVLSEKFAELSARFKANIHQLYANLFDLEKEALVALQNGEKNLGDRIRQFHDRINEVHTQIAQWTAETKSELETYAATIQGDWVHILHQYSQNIDLTGKTMRTMFQQLTQDLMKNLLEVAIRVVPNAFAIIENLKQQGLLSFYNQ